MASQPKVSNLVGIERNRHWVNSVEICAMFPHLELILEAEKLNSYSKVARRAYALSVPFLSNLRIRTAA